MCGLPSITLFIILTSKPSSFIFNPVPFVAINLKPRPFSFVQSVFSCDLSSSFTLIKTLPSEGINCPAPIIDFPNASPKVLPLPITSPVDFISGPRIGSTFLNLLNGKTGAFTA